MNVVLWVVAVVLGLIVAAAGVEKLATPQAEFRRKRPWAEAADARTVRVVGALEVLGAVGLIAPGVTGIATGLVPLAAACLAVLLLAAIVVEARHHRPGAAFVLPVVSLVLALAVAVGRAGPWGL
jgi:uncharacterized membrane protein